MIREVLVAVFLSSGVGFILLAALGVLRFQDSLTRMAAVSKASTLGLSLIFLAVIVHSGVSIETVKALLTIVIIWLSAPIAAHLLGRAALLTDEKLSPKTKGTELVYEMKNQRH